MKYTIGLDIGGTKIHSIVAEWNDDFLVTRSLPKIVDSKRVMAENLDNEQKFFGEIISVTESLIQKFGKDNVERIGVGIAGSLDKSKTILNPRNLPFKNFPIVQKLKDALGMPIYADNDANCFTWSEHIFGAAAAASSTIGITLGTGVGGGIVFDYKGKSILWSGASGSAAEVGRMVLDSGRTLEDLCSSRAQYLWEGEDPLKIEEKARTGDKKSKEIYITFGSWLGIGIANLINIINPEVIVVGGSFSNAWDLFEKEMIVTSQKYIISSQEAKKTEIVKAKLGDDAGAIGAAYLI